MRIQEYIENKSREIYLVHYLNETMSDTCILIVPSLSWMNIGPNRLYTNIGNLGIQKNISTVVFDYPGHGESSGDLDDITVKSLMQSLIDVYNYVKKQYKHIVIVTEGIGSLIYALCATYIKCDKVIYLFPEFKLNEFISLFLVHEDTKQYLEYQFISEDIKKNYYQLFKGLLGLLHDSKYLPIPKALLIEISDIHCLTYFTKNQKYTVFSEKEIESDNIFNANVIVKESFKKNKFPKDLYANCNLWPLELERLSYEVVEEVFLEKWQPAITGKKITISHSITKSIRTLVSISDGDDNLLGIIQNPHKKNKITDSVIFIPGIGGEKIDNHKAWPRLSEFLTSKGVQTLRYENSFSGNSNGKLDDFTIMKVVQQTQLFIELLKKINNKNDIRYHFVCWSAGIKIILRLFSEFPENVSTFCAWNPVIDDNPQDRGGIETLPKYIKNREGKLVTQVGGEFVGLDLIKEDKNINYMELVEQFHEQASTIWSLNAINTKLYNKLKCEKCASKIVNSNDHLFSYFLMKEVFDETIKQLFSKMR